MNEWYFYANGKEHGPFSVDQGKDFIRENPGAYCWRQGFSDWQLAYEVPEVRRMKKDGVTPFPPPPASMIEAKPPALPAVGQQTQQTPPPVQMGNPVSHNTTSTATPPPIQTPEQSSGGFGTSGYTEGLDYRIVGHETQFVEIELDPRESVVAEAGAMMYKTENVEMETIFGDGSNNGKQEGGIMGTLLSAGRRLLTNESLFTTVFTQNGHGKGRVAFGAPFPGTIMALKLDQFNGTLICQKDSFLAGAKGVQIGIHFQQKILTGLFGGEGFILQKLEGDGWVFVHVGGTVQKIDLAPGETLHVDTGCLAFMTSNVDYDIQRAGGIKTMLFGGEGLFFARLRGPGTVWLQSLPFSRLAGRMLAASPAGTNQQGEGSILGGFGRMLGGDR